MSRFANPLLAEVAEARRRNFGPADGLPGDALDFDSAVDRVAALLHRLEFATPDEAAGLVASPFGQTGLAHTWKRLPVERRQLYRRRAGVLLESAVRGRELRARPEENVAA
jgi:hypothetical protein